MSEIVIISPHPDDEIIGCFTTLKTAKDPIIIIYPEPITEERKKESLTLKNHFNNIRAQLFLRSIPGLYLKKENTFYFPDPIYENHPAHRTHGFIGENLARNGYNIIFYTTNMTAPYINEVSDSNKKRDLLNEVYPSQKDMWKYEAKYYLFEGKCKWIF